jgi:hypothetical protein
MIIRPPTNWLRMLFVWDGSVLKTIVPQLLLMLAISVLAVVTRGHLFVGIHGHGAVPAGGRQPARSSRLLAPLRATWRRARSGAAS